MREYGIVCQASAFLYTEDHKVVTDEVLMGWAVEILEKRCTADGRASLRVLTHYGYEGYLDGNTVRSASEEELCNRDLGGSLCVIRKAFADMMETPKVQGRILQTLGKGSFVTRVSEAEHGYCLVETADGARGYLMEVGLSRRLDDDGYLYASDRKDYFLRQSLRKWGSEKAFRDALVDCAKSYLGTQYRWGGKSSSGLDCSGLTFLCYQMNGILIYRDAKLRPDYPVQPIEPEQIKKGDLLYFPGHIAMYLGRGRYIHCTGNKESFGCVCNSLCPTAADYREDLAKNILNVGSIENALKLC
ncbi:MAG: C40 family peptidase [Fusicatenibacter sp.]|nr:C40 family peptidase [Fusicatenibacter sp.]